MDNFVFPIHLVVCHLTIGGNWRIQSKPMQTNGEHDNDTQKGSIPPQFWIKSGTIVLPG